MQTNLIYYSDLESEMLDVMVKRTVDLQKELWYWRSVIYTTLLILSLLFLVVLPSLTLQLGTYMLNPIIEPYIQPLLLGVVLLGIIVFIYMMGWNWYFDRLHLEKRRFLVRSLNAYFVITVVALLIVVFQSSSISLGELATLGAWWFAIALGVFGTMMIVIATLLQHLPIEIWIWVLSVKPYRKGHKPIDGDMPSYLEFINNVTACVETGRGWDRPTWQGIQTIAETRLGTTSSHGQNASFIVAILAIIGLLPVLAKDTWENIIVLAGTYSHAFSINTTSPAALFIQNVLFAGLLFAASFAFQYFVRESAHLRLAEAIFYRATYQICVLSVATPTSIVLPPLVENNTLVSTTLVPALVASLPPSNPTTNSTFPRDILLVSASVGLAAVITWIVGRTRRK